MAHGHSDKTRHALRAKRAGVTMATAASFYEYYSKEHCYLEFLGSLHCALGSKHAHTC